MSKRHNNHVIQFLKKHASPELIDLWCEKDNQEEFKKIRFTKDEGRKRPLSSFFLFCKDNRPRLVAEKPYYPATRIVSLLGKEWQKHKEKKDDVYTKYKNLSQEHFFYYIHHDDILHKYPHFNHEDITQLLALMFEKYKNSLDSLDSKVE